MNVQISGRIRYLILFFCVLFLLISYIAADVLDGRKETWEDDPALYETVDENGIFHIYDREDLITFLKYVKNGQESLDAVLEADIEVNEAVYLDTYYAGHFDGGGHKLTGMGWSLFISLEKGGVIENLTMEVDLSPLEEIGAGGIVYYNYGTIRDCRVYGTVTGYDYAGGIAAVNFAVIEDCDNYAAVTSLEDGENFETENRMDGYGAGGIAGFCTTSRSKEDSPADCKIADCDNYGDVTAMSYAGGIVACLDDETGGLTPAGSVEELVQYEDFTTPSEQQEETVEETEDLEEEETPGKVSDEPHYSLVRCRNMGTVTVKNREDVRTGWNTQAAGICADLSQGDIYRCENLGNVRFAEDAPERNENGYAYTNRPMAITYNMGFAPTKEHHIIECVSLKGTIEGSMRHENIMELTKEEIADWEAGNWQGEYISNNWEFNLAEAADICGLKPLNIREETQAGEKRNYYRCSEFAVYLPAFLKIEEVCLPEGGAAECYALHITVDKEAYEKEIVNEENAEDIISSDENAECWIIRKEADIKAAMKEAKESNTRDEWRVRYFAEEAFATAAPYYYMKISPLNLPFHDTFCVRYTEGERIFLEGSIPDQSLRDYMQEGNHTLGNVIAMPLIRDSEAGFSAKWLMVFTMKETNIRPSRSFIRMIENGFYPLTGSEETYVVKEGDTLWELADLYTLNPRNWKLLAGWNGIDDPKSLAVGSILIVPDSEEWKIIEPVILTPDVIKKYG